MMKREYEAGSLEISTLKIYVLCQDEVEQAIEDGRCGAKLFSICMEIQALIAERWHLQAAAK